MRRVSIINQKGGVGKTTTSANLGAALARSGWRVLLIDLDPQAHLTMHYTLEVDPERPTAYDVLTAGCPLDEAILHVRDNVWLVPSDVDLAAAEMELAGEDGRQTILRRAVDAMSGSYDVLLVDCPPSVGLLTVNALAATFEVMIPLQPHFLALQGLARLHETVTLVHQHLNPQLRIGGVVICMHDAGTRLAAEVIEDVGQFIGALRDIGAAWSDARLFSTRIRRNVKLAESPSHGKTIFDYEPGCHGALDYAALADEIFGGRTTQRLTDVVGDDRSAGAENNGRPAAAVLGQAHGPAHELTPSVERAADVDIPVAPAAPPLHGDAPAGAARSWPAGADPPQRTFPSGPS